MKKILFLITFSFVSCTSSTLTNEIKAICPSSNLGLTIENQNPDYLNAQNYNNDISNWQVENTENQLKIFYSYNSHLSGGSRSVSYTFQKTTDNCLLPENRRSSVDLCEYLGNWNGLNNDAITELQVQQYIPNELVVCRIKTIVAPYANSFGASSQELVENVWGNIN